MVDRRHESEQSLQARRLSSRRAVIGARRGLEAMIVATRAAVIEAAHGRRGTTQVVGALSEDFAFIRPADGWRPWRFLRQMAGAPPLRVGTEGFDPALVDDDNPARHYMAFVFIGYWLPNVLAVLVLWGWELAGFVRYGGHWSWPDIHMGIVGLRHGRLVRRYGAGILPALMAQDLAPRTRRSKS